MLYNVFTSNFGGYLLALVGVMTVYAVVDQVAPGYSGTLAFVTLFSIIIIFLSRKKVI